MTQENIYIKHVSLQNLWGRYNIEWELDPRVNILVGANGTGKSTLLKVLDAILTKKNHISKQGMMIKIKMSNKNTILYPTDGHFFDSTNVAYINTFDSPIKDKRRLKRNGTTLDLELDALLYQRSSDIYSLADYRLRATNIGGNPIVINEKISYLFNIINAFFSKTEKIIYISERDNRIYFSLDSKYQNYHTDEFSLLPEDLSSGEKQLLIILLTVFLQREKHNIYNQREMEKPFILILDEPEISLHTRWQRILIDKILELNPNCQIIIATHSASVFGNGWMDKVKRMEEILI